MPGILPLMKVPNTATLHATRKHIELCNARSVGTSKACYFVKHSLAFFTHSAPFRGEKNAAGKSQRWSSQRIKILHYFLQFTFPHSIGMALAMCVVQTGGESLEYHHCKAKRPLHSFVMKTQTSILKNKVFLELSSLWHFGAVKRGCKAPLSFGRDVCQMAHIRPQQLICPARPFADNLCRTTSENLR